MQALAIRGSIFLSYGLHVSWAPAPWGDLWGAQTSAEQTRSQTAFLSHSGSRQAAKWRETVGRVPLLPLGTPQPPAPLLLCLLVHLSPRDGHSPEGGLSLLLWEPRPGWLPAPAAPKTHG